MIPILDRRHVLSLRKYPDEIGFVVETAVIAYFGCAQIGVCKQITRFCDPEIVYVGYEGYSCLLLEEVTESGVRHIDHLCSIRQGYLVGDVFFNVSAYLADSSGL